MGRVSFVVVILSIHIRLQVRLDQHLLWTESGQMGYLIFLGLPPVLLTSLAFEQVLKQLLIVRVRSRKTAGW